MLIKYLQTFDSSCPPFLQGGKMSQILAQISSPVVFEPPYFCTAAVYWKTKTNLSRTDDRSTITSNLGWVGPPNSLNRWPWKFAYISSIPAAQAEYSATNVIPPVGAVAAVKRLPCQITQFAPTVHRGSPKRVKVVNFLYILRSRGPRLVYRHQCYTTYWGSSWCKKSTVPYLAIRPLHFTGAKISPH